MCPPSGLVKVNAASTEVKDYTMLKEKSLPFTMRIICLLNPTGFISLNKGSIHVPLIVFSLTPIRLMTKTLP